MVVWVDFFYVLLLWVGGLVAARFYGLIGGWWLLFCLFVCGCGFVLCCVRVLLGLWLIACFAVYCLFGLILL